MKKIFIVAACMLYSCTLLFAQPGALDASFANGGKFIVPDNQYTNPHMGAANAAAIQTNGKIIMAGQGYDYTNPSATDDFGVTRLNADGTLDNSFGGDGKVFIDFSTADFYSTIMRTMLLYSPTVR